VVLNLLSKETTLPFSAYFPYFEKLKAGLLQSQINENHILLSPSDLLIRVLKIKFFVCLFPHITPVTCYLVKNENYQASHYEFSLAFIYFPSLPSKYADHSGRAV
jgi:hypothetical protein